MRTDKHIVADSDVTQYTREGPDLDAAPYGGVTLTGGISRYASCPQYHTSEDVTVITDYRCLANDRAMPMVQDESTANLASWVDFRARQELSTRGDQERGSLQRSLRIAFRCASQAHDEGSIPFARSSISGLSSGLARFSQIAGGRFGGRFRIPKLPSSRPAAGTRRTTDAHARPPCRLLGNPRYWGGCKKSNIGNLSRRTAANR